MARAVTACLFCSVCESDPPLARDHSKTLRQRNEKARREGFRSYADKRKVLATVHDEDMFTETVEDEISGSSSREDLRAAKIYYEAFHTKKGKYDYSTSGPKAAWFVEVTHHMSYNEWADRYPMGVREYAPVR